MQTNVSSHHSMIVFGSIVAVGAGGAIILVVLDQLLPETHCLGSNGSRRFGEAADYKYMK